MGVVIDPYNTNLIALTAIMGNTRIRVPDGHIMSWNMIPPPPKTRKFLDNGRMRVVREIPLTMCLEIFAGKNGFWFDKLDPYSPAPIGSKIVDDCTNDELLYAIQYRLGLIKKVD